MIKHAFGYCVTPRELFAAFNNKRLKLTCDTCKANTWGRHKWIVYTRILAYSIKLVLDDIVNNGIKFNLPVQGKKSYLKMDKISGRSFRDMKAAGSFPNVDYLKSNFSAYRIAFYIPKKDLWRKRPVYMSAELRDLKDKYTNEGRQYS